MVSAECYICNSSTQSKFVSVKDDTTNEIFNIVKCVCGFCYVSPRPDQDEMARYYNLIDYHPHSKGSGLLYYIYKLVQKITYRSKYRLLSSYSFNSITHLDYGGGDGSFSSYLNRKKNISSSYYDPYCESSKSKEFVAGQYNIITRWHVLEHSYDLDILFTEINNSLSESGVLFIAVPNIDAYDRYIYMDKWAAYDLPRHLYHFNHRTLSKLLDKKGYKVIRKKRMLFDTFYISILSSMKISKASVAKSIFLSCLIVIRVLFNGPEYSSSLLYVCQRKK